MAIFTAKILSGFLNPKIWVWGAGIVLVGWLSWNIYGFVDRALEDRQTIVTQQVKLELRKNEIATLNGQIEQAREAQRISEEARLEEELREEELHKIRDKAISAGDERDGELAPVLKDTLRALRGSAN